MTKTRAFLGAVALVGATAAVTATVLPQQADSKDTWTKYCVRCLQHGVLDQAAGKWEHRVKVYESAKAEAGEAVLTADYRWIYGGRYLVGEYDGFVGGEVFNAKEVLGYDNFRQEFWSIWLDNSSTTYALSRGKYDEKTKTLTFEGTQDNLERGVRDEKFRIVYQFAGPSEMSIEIHRPGPDGKLAKAVEVKGTKVE
jgi:hypothetical protein